MPAPVPTAIKLAPVTSPTPYVCNCGVYVAPSTQHNCAGAQVWTTAPLPFAPQPSPTEARIAAALERIAKVLEEIAAKGARSR